MVSTSALPLQERWVGRVGHLCLARKPLSGTKETKFTVSWIWKPCRAVTMSRVRDLSL